MLSLSRYSQKKKYKKVTKVTEVLQGSVYNWLLTKNILTLDAVYARDKSVKLHVYYLVPTDKQTDYKHRCLAMTGGGVTLELRRISNVATERRLHVTVNRKSRNTHRQLLQVTDESTARDVETAAIDHLPVKCDS